MNLRIAIVCGHFIPDLGYFEVHLARACSRLGHTVRVVTSVKVPGYIQGITFKNYSAGQVLTPEPAYSIERLPAMFSAGQMVLSQGVKKTVKHFDPDLIFVIGLGKIFPKPVFDMKGYREKTITFLGDNEHSFSNDSLKTQLIRSMFKRPVYRKAIEHSKRLYAYTNSTLEVITQQVGEELAARLKSKLEQTSLGFDSSIFSYDENLRNAKRAEMELADAFTWICVSRVSPNKDFEPFLQGLGKLKDSGLASKALFVGADQEGKHRLDQRVSALGLEDRVEILPFMDHRDLNALYNASDAAWYPMAAISNFEGMGTGIPILLPNERNVSHILKEDSQGSYFKKSEVPELMAQWTKRPASNRADMAQQAHDRFEYKVIAQKVLDEIMAQ